MLGLQQLQCKHEYGIVLSMQRSIAQMCTQRLNAVFLNLKKCVHFTLH